MKIAKIETMGMVDGPGIRTVIFTTGCPLRCLYCHNPEMWTDVKTKDYTTKDLLNIFEKYRTYYEVSNGGVTFSGGEPLIQDELVEILKKCKEAQIHTAIDTSGHYNRAELATNIIMNTDLIILDIKHYNNEEYQKLTSQPIDKLLEFIKILNEYQKKVWIRSVIVPGINDNEEYINNLASFIKQINNVTNIELLPFHNLARIKYEELNLDYKLQNTPIMDNVLLKKLEDLLKKKTNHII